MLLPPEGSKYNKIEAFEECEIELLEILSCNDSFVCLCGDFNARTGGLHDELEYTIFLMILDAMVLQEV